jgi:molybdopterin converting factor subunit 1
MASDSVQVQVLFFAKSREVAGASEQSLDLPPGASTEDLLAALVDMYPGLSSVLQTCVLALNQEYLEQGAKVLLKSGDEVAIIPPLSGG